MMNRGRMKMKVLKESNFHAPSCSHVTQLSGDVAKIQTATTKQQKRPNSIGLLVHVHSLC